MSSQSLDKESFVEFVQKDIFEYVPVGGDEGMVETRAHKYKRSRGTCTEGKESMIEVSSMGSLSARLVGEIALFLAMVSMSFSLIDSRKAVDKI